MTLLIATTNSSKSSEIRGLLADVPAKLVSLRDLAQVSEPEETGETFEENARIKAEHYDRTLARLAGAGQDDSVLTVGEDSGLMIDALDGEPGVRSARFLR
ncbi:MAG: non-canonical purine NTP pyrophosphatase, partial [Vicinamibacterales bacterium]